jgi:hypothetical protein
MSAPATPLTSSQIRKRGLKMFAIGGGIFATKRLIYAEFLSCLDQETSKTPTVGWRIVWIKFAATGDRDINWFC